ncbi:MAG: putative aldolase class 2 protein [Candidatus Dadabacteria bacterium]|nr:MAG: putative aldolase class 2 protein [Candidatus Dadabacteria bacterium]
MGNAVKDSVSTEEWQTRVDLAALYRLVALYGWDDLVFTHISARVPGEDNHFLLNPYGLLFEEIKASDLVKIDLDGNIVSETEHFVNAAGFTIHSAVHGNGQHNHAVIHTHSNDGVAVSAQEHGLLPISQTAMVIRNECAYHDYEGIALNHDEREITNDLGDKHCMILRNHGLLATGATCADAWLRLFFLERACTMQIKALSGGSKLNMVPDDVIELVTDQGQMASEQGIGNLAWPALIRKLDKIDISYKE